MIDINNLIEQLQQPIREFPTLSWKSRKQWPRHRTPTWCVIQNQEEDQRLADRIATEGVWEEWKNGRCYQYWYGDGFKYWRIDPVINRAKI
jgi:hypothetical protein